MVSGGALADVGSTTRDALPVGVRLGHECLIERLTLRVTDGSGNA